uniref:Uncharacterized protein n=1 Tax=Arundo donax TaxID=35708 RepID=A0A0A9E7D8_ARUDO
MAHNRRNRTCTITITLRAKNVSRIYVFLYLSHEKSTMISMIETLKFRMKKEHREYFICCSDMSYHIYLYWRYNYVSTKILFATDNC